MGDVSKKSFLKIFLWNKVYPKLCKQKYFEPCLDHSLVTTIFDLRDLKFGMCIRDSINKTCWKNGKDLSNAAPKIKLWNHTKKTHFPVFAKNFRRPCMKLKIFFCQFPNPWTLRVSGMGRYTSKCEKSQNHCTLLCSLAGRYDNPFPPRFLAPIDF